MTPSLSDAELRAMRPDGDIVQLLAAASQQVVNVTSLPVEQQAEMLETLRRAVTQAAREHGLEGLAPQLWAFVVCQLVSSGYEKLVQMMFEARDKTREVSEKLGDAAASKLSHELADLCHQHLVRVREVSNLLAADGAGAVCALQFELDSKTAANAIGKVKAVEDLGQNWRAN